MIARMFDRRHVLQNAAVGFGWLAATAMLHQHAASEERRQPPEGLFTKESPYHFAPRARRVIFMFMKGGPSQIDTFDYKPLLNKHDGQPLPFDKPRVQFAATGNLLASPWSFRQYGQSGIPVSSLFPNVAKYVDDICILNSVYGTNAAHGGASLKLHTGSDTFVRPGMGAWVSYGLGTENQNLPAFITICPTLAHGGVNNWGSAFLPADCQGVPLGVASQPSTAAQVKYISNSRWTSTVQRRQLDLLQQLNKRHSKVSSSSDALEARIASFELAYRMQAEMPLVQDLSQETAGTLAMYGLDNPITEDFGRQCLLARRFAEAGVRFIQITHSDTKVQWDQHSGLKAGHDKNAAEVDQPIAALLADLKQRGLLDDTLLLWGGEFGRTPVAQGKDGRDHNPDGFTMWMAGAGVRGGTRYGATDEFGFYARENKMHIHDVHATVLHLLGLDHKRLTFRHAGRDFRLTDIAGEVHHGVFS
ncbi:MAG: DUF1501 domain-containing protein [Planctomycetales bacterium]|nr:DUF1501 domain-containing protein [Planctomycetales bacterium]